jgi:hypothetical protein
MRLGGEDMTTSLAARIERARRAAFVGRVAELELFRTALLSEEPPFVVLHIVGPGGVGKTSLLREFERIAAEQGRAVLHIDGRDIEPSPKCFAEAIGERPSAPFVLFIDTYEALASLDRWLRESFLPTLPAYSVVVIAGRSEPAPAWRTDLEWAALTRIVTLRGLHPEESRAFLNARGIDSALQGDVLAVTHGHPLALSLLAEVLAHSDAPVTLEAQPAPEIVRVLLERFVQEVPSPAHHTALAVCAIALSTTEPLLAEMMGAAAAHDCFEWLRRLSFIDEGSYGLYPHDLARDVLAADDRWRDPAGHQHLYNHMIGYFQSRLVPPQTGRATRALLEWFYVVRFVPYMTQFFDWHALESAYAEPATPADTDSILMMVRAHEGDESAQIASHWLRRQPRAFLVFRNSAHELLGFMAQLALHEATDDDLAADPGAATLMHFVELNEPPSEGEEISALRFWMHRERYQEKTAAINLTAMHCTAFWMTHPRLAWSFTVMSDPDWWQPHFEGLNFMRAPEADFGIGGRRYGVYAHDWRKQPFAEWPRGAASPHEVSPPTLLREVGETRSNASQPAPLPAEQSERSALSHADFAAAVRQALRDYTRPDVLRANPLMSSRSIRAATEGADFAPAALQALLREAAASLTANPKDERLYRALLHTFFEPALTQERAAELLDLPFSTYRYHLTRGIERVVAYLWQREQSSM